jgi:hypothetical protein
MELQDNKPSWHFRCRRGAVHPIKSNAWLRQTMSRKGSERAFRARRRFARGCALLFAEIAGANGLPAHDPKVSPLFGTLLGPPASALVRSRRASLLFNVWAPAPIPKAKRVGLEEISTFIEGLALLQLRTGPLLQFLLHPILAIKASEVSVKSTLRGNAFRLWR